MKRPSVAEHQTDRLDVISVDLPEFLLLYGNGEEVADGRQDAVGVCCFLDELFDSNKSLSQFVDYRVQSALLVGIKFSELGLDYLENRTFYWNLPIFFGY